MKLSSLPLKMSVPYRNRTYNRVLGARIHPGNIYNSELIQVKESLDFSIYSVISCQNKKTCFHLCKAPFGARPVLGAPGGYNHSVPSSSLSWSPLRFSFVTMNTWFSYWINYIITCCRSDVDDFLTIFIVLYVTSLLVLQTESFRTFYYRSLRINNSCFLCFKLTS